MRILYVEDEKMLADAVIHLLKKANIMVDWTADGEDGLALGLAHKYDAIVLDIMLSRLSGWEIVRALRQQKVTTPIIMLSALSEVDDKVRALDLGADDYLAKPFKTAELIARLKALTRRPALQESTILRFGDLTFDAENAKLNHLDLTAKEVAILELLFRHPEQLIHRERLLSYGWGNETSPSESYVEVYISYLRKKFRQLGSSVKIISVRNLGYKITKEPKHV